MRYDLQIYIDGACRGNPGPAGVGVVVMKDGKIIREIAKAIGDATNNIAEYMAFITALKEALILRVEHIKIYTDSELLYRQYIGQYKIKNVKLKELFEEARHLSEGFTCVDLEHVPREQNNQADGLASGVLKKKQTKMVASA